VRTIRIDKKRLSSDELSLFLCEEILFVYYIATTVTLNFPDSLVDYQNDTIRFIASKLYESGKLSLGQAADMASLSKLAFAEIL